MKIDWHLSRRVLGALNASRCGAVRFVQIGGNDGRLSDPIWGLATQNPWTGIIVEPVIDYYQQLRLHYAHFSRIKCINLAVDAADGTRMMYVVRNALLERQRASGKRWFQGLASFHEEHLWNHGLSEADYHVVQVETRPGQSLVDEYALGECDALVVDVEGAELVVLRSFDFSSWRPRCVVFESEHMTAPEKARVAQLLGDAYYVKWSRPDSVALLKKSSRSTLASVSDRDAL